MSHGIMSSWLQVLNSICSGLTEKDGPSCARKMRKLVRSVSRVSLLGRDVRFLRFDAIGIAAIVSEASGTRPVGAVLVFAHCITSLSIDGRFAT